MSAGTKWLIAYLLLMIVAVLALGLLLNRAQSKPAWDGTFECRPGEVYTTKECP